MTNDTALESSVFELSVPYIKFEKCVVSQGAMTILPKRDCEAFASEHQISRMLRSNQLRYTAIPPVRLKGEIPHPTLKNERIEKSIMVFLGIKI